MARIISGPLITVQVTQGGTPLAHAVVTPSSPVYSDPEMTTAVATVTASSAGAVQCYALPGVYTFTCAGADPIEPVEVLGDEGTRDYILVPTGIADGQLLEWSAALDAFTPVNPSGASLLAYAENNTGTTLAGLTTTSGTAGVVDVTGCSIVVPASTRPVFLDGCVVAFATVAPTNATPIALITEVSNGVDTPVTLRGSVVPMSVINKTVSIIVPPTQLATSTARARTFKLQIWIVGSGTWTVENGANNDRSTIRAMAG